MFVFTAKLNKRIAAGAILCAAIAISAVMLTDLSSDKEVVGAADSSPAVTAVSSKMKIETNDDRLSFLTSYGWEVEAKPLEFVEVRVPDEFNETFEKYNDLQKGQGYDLAKFKGKRVIRYSYRVKNYPSGEEDVVANLLIYKNKIIGGDICSAKLEGFMHGFAMPEGKNSAADLGAPLPDAPGVEALGEALPEVEGSPEE